MVDWHDRVKVHDDLEQAINHAQETVKDRARDVRTCPVPGCIEGFKPAKRYGQDGREYNACKKCECLYALQDAYHELRQLGREYEKQTRETRYELVPDVDLQPHKERSPDYPPERRRELRALLEQVGLPVPLKYRDDFAPCGEYEER